MPKKDSAARAFIEYARFGLDRRELTAIDAAKIIRAAVTTDARALKLIAVYDTLRVLCATDNAEAANAVREVYFSGEGRVPRKNEIGYAVRRFAIANNMDERTVWRRLETAKRLYISLYAAQISRLEKIL